VISGLHHVRLAGPRGCEAEARAFYSELLGLREIEQPPVLERRGGVWWALGDERQLHIGTDADFVAAPAAHPGLTLEDVAELEALAERLQRAGFKVCWDTELPGWRRFYVKDPFGNRLELLALATD
jgi:catechol 2,3-dioxygenase-like lactoylglutathione lyase family enzyme